MIPLAQPPRKDESRFDDWTYRLWKRISATAGIAWAIIDKTGSNLTDIETRNHADLQNLNTASYTHLTATNHTDLTDGGDSALHYHTVMGNITFNPTAPVLPTFSFPNYSGQISITATGEPNGFLDRTEVTLSWSNATRTLTVTPVGASFTIVANGNYYTKTAAETHAIANVTGSYFIYWGSDGVLASTATFDQAIINAYCLVASLYWNATTALAVPDCLDERHGSEMPADVHIYLHNSRGTAYNLDGGLLPTVTADGDGSLLAHIEYSATSGYIWDEDIKHTISAHALTDVIPVMYKTGAAVWTFDETSAAIVRTTGTGRAAYNQDVAGTWQLTELANNKFSLAHLFAIPGVTKKWMIVMGIAQYNNISDASDGAAAEIVSISGVPLAEFKSIATFVIQTSDSYTNAVKSRIRLLNSGESFSDWRYTTIGGMGISQIQSPASDLLSATTTINISSATAPTSGQALIATSPTAATWQTITSSATSNVISAPTTIAADTSYVVASYLKIDSDLTINGNLLITG